MVLSQHVVDPTLFLVLMCVRNIRAWLQFAGPDVQPHFFHIARRRDIKHSDVWGPAGAFAYNLARLNWSITSDACCLQILTWNCTCCTALRVTFSANLKDHGKSTW